MRVFATSLLLFVLPVLAKAPPKELQIGVTHSVAECPYKSQNGDTLLMHYTGRLWDGTKFDASYDRGKPFDFEMGVGHVIKGWDFGLRDMCIGEKRRLKIPSDLAYGPVGAGDVIPPDAALVFDVELLDIQGPRMKSLRASQGKDEL